MRSSLKVNISTQGGSLPLQCSPALPTKVYVLIFTNDLAYYGTDLITTPNFFMIQATCVSSFGSYKVQANVYRDLSINNGKDNNKVSINFERRSTLFVRRRSSAKRQFYEVKFYNIRSF